MKITKSKIALSFLTFPIVSFLLFSTWAHSIANDPSSINVGTLALQYAVVFATTVACNTPIFWVSGLVVAIGIVIYATIIRRNVNSYILLNSALFAIFLIPIILAITGNSRFCMSFIL